MIRFWSTVLYFVYKGEYRLHLWFNKINPAMLLFKLPLLKRTYARKGISVDYVRDQIEGAYHDPVFGIGMMFAGGLMYILVLSICLGFAHLYSAIVRQLSGVTASHYIGYVVVSFVVNHFLLFRRDKFLRYFKECDRMPPVERRKWAWVSAATVIAILVFLVGSFIYMDHRLNSGRDDKASHGFLRHERVVTRHSQ